MLTRSLNKGLTKGTATLEVVTAGAASAAITVAATAAAAAAAAAVAPAATAAKGGNRTTSSSRHANFVAQVKKHMRNPNSRLLNPAAYGLNIWQDDQVAGFLLTDWNGDGMSLNLASCYVNLGRLPFLAASVQKPP